MRKIVTLLSSKDVSLYRENTSSRFTNILPTHIYPRQGRNSLYIRVLSIFVPVPPNFDDISWVFLDQLESSCLLSSDQDQCLARVHLKSDSTNADGIQYQEFPLSTYHKVSVTPLHKLNITIASDEGIPIQPVEDLTTCVTIEIMDDISSAGEHFEVYGSSYQDGGPFPINRVNDFHIPLPYEISLDESWEVALTAMSFPANLVWSPYWVQIEDKLFYLNASQIKTPRDALVRVREAVAVSDVADRVETDVRQSTERPELGPVLIMRHKSTEEALNPYEEDGLTILMSEEVMKLLNPLRPPRHYRSRTKPGRRFKVIKLSHNLDEPLVPDSYSPLGLVFCNAVKPNIVDGELHPLLKVIPMGQFVFSDSMQFFQPKYHTYVDTVNQKVSSIRISIMDSKHRQFQTHCQTYTSGITVMLKFRKKRNAAGL